MSMTPEQNKFLEKLYSDQYKLMYYVARRILRNPTAAADVVSETFCILTAEIERTMTCDNPVGFSFRILRNCAFNELRKRKIHAEIPLERAVDTSVESEWLSVPDLLPSGLTSEEKEVLLLRLEQKLPYTEIAAHLRLTESACRMRFSRARARCVQLLRKEK